MLETNNATGQELVAAKQKINELTEQCQARDR